MLDVVVVGSGYGGSVLAARLAPHGRVLVVERGRRWESGGLPVTALGLAGELATRRNPLGLWSVRIGRGTGNAMAHAVGGSSVVNYGITARPDDHTFDEWPLPAHRMAPYYERALAMLRPTAAPFGDELGDKQFIDLVEPGRRVDLVNTIDWSRCTACGRCVPGCNEGAKRTLGHTYLRAAVAAGAEIRSETEVIGWEQRQGGWEVTIAPTDRPEERTTVQTRVLAVAAGTFGTLDLMEAHRDRIPLSPAFGQGMSMNGDALAFLYNTKFPMSGHHGAPITTSARLIMNDPSGRPRTLMIMSGRIPTALQRMSAGILAVIGGLIGRRQGPGDDEPRGSRGRRRLRDLWSLSATGALAHTYMYKLDGQDQARGVARFEDGRSVMDWEDYVDDPVLTFAEARLRLWADKVGGTVIRDVARWPGMRSFGVHPLGGCRMGRTVEDGVLDDHCRVLRPGGGVWPGLYVVDGSAIPTALGVPASLTIAAVAERAAEAMEADVRGGR
ncbi:MAG: hypothetical protein AMXMBFR64_24790 [Myxococcales bacterium]